MTLFVSRREFFLSFFTGRLAGDIFRFPFRYAKHKAVSFYGSNAFPYNFEDVCELLDAGYWGEDED